MKIIVWFRQDLRIADNPALLEAASRGEVIPLYLHEGEARTGNAHPLGGASKWWLHHSLVSLRQDLGGLVCRHGDPRYLLPEIARELGADAVYWNRCYEPHAVSRDTELKRELQEAGHEVRSFAGSVLFEPWELETKAGGPFKVYSPFWKALQAQDVARPQPRPRSLRLTGEEADEGIDSLCLLPRHPNWAEGWEDMWSPGESGADDRLTRFLENGVQGYGELRNRPDLENVSRLSPHLHFGEISPRQIWHRTMAWTSSRPGEAKDGMKFLSEVAWRDFSNHLIYHFPTLPERNWKPAFDAYPWRESDTDLAAWQQGRTGYPMVDAGMRELWQTGYMHNRVRMLVASFLVKHLRIHWSHGEEWFRDTLVDADLANNSAGWQWVAGSGADAAPYFRIFNPLSQGPKFDPQGDYVRRWIPELANLDNSHIHAPFEADADVLEAAGVELGKTYPKPIVDHAKARQEALDGYEAVKEAGRNDE